MGELLNSKRFISGVIGIAVMIGVALYPPLGAIEQTLVVAIGAIVFTWVLGYNIQDWLTVVYTQAGVIVTATPSKTDDELYANATTILKAVGVLKATEDPETPYRVDISALEVFLKKLKL